MQNTLDTLASMLDDLAAEFTPETPSTPAVDAAEEQQDDDLLITDPAEIQSTIDRYSKPRRVWEGMFLTSSDSYAADLVMAKTHRPLRKVLDHALAVARRKVAWEGAAIDQVFLYHFATKYGKTVVAHVNEDCTEITAIIVA